MFKTLIIAVLSASLCLADTLSAPVETGGTTVAQKILITAPGKFEASFTRANGFGKTYYDLKNDPAKQLNLAPIYSSGLAYSGLFWVKIGRPNSTDSWEPNPPDTLRVIEANSARIRIRSKGTHTVYGTSTSPWTGVFFDQIYTIYPNGNVFISYTIEAAADAPYTEMNVITRSTGKWGPNGKNEAHPLGEFGPDAPAGSTASSWHLQYTNGPTYFEDILMVAQKGKYNANYWGMGYNAEDYRTSFRQYGTLGNGAITAGKHPLYYLMRFADNMNDIASANQYALDYRMPDALNITLGQADKSDPGDADGDGYNEGEGCYVIAGGTTGARFTITGSASVKRLSPVFKIKNWVWGAPASIQWAGATINRGTDFNAAAVNGTLVLQVFRDATSSVEAVVTGSGPGIRSKVTMVPLVSQRNNEIFDLLGRRVTLTNQNATASGIGIMSRNGLRILVRGEGK